MAVGLRERHELGAEGRNFSLEVFVRRVPKVGGVHFGHSIGLALGTGLLPQRLSSARSAGTSQFALSRRFGQAVVWDAVSRG